MTSWYEKSVRKIEGYINYIRDNPSETRKKYGENVIITDRGIFPQDSRRSFPEKATISVLTSIEKIVNPETWILTGA